MDGGLTALDFPPHSHNRRVRKAWRPTGEDPEDSADSDAGMPATIGGLASDVRGVLRDMCWTGNARVLAHCEQWTRPTPEQIEEINILATEFLASHDVENSLRGYMMLRPSQQDDLHRGQPTPRSETCIHHKYTATLGEHRAAQSGAAHEAGLLLQQQGSTHGVAGTGTVAIFDAPYSQ